MVSGFATKLDIEGGFLGLTVTEALEETDRPTESVTTTVTADVPVAVGVQLNEEAFWEVQPPGRPEYAYLKLPVPPEAATERKIDVPRVIEDGETVRLEVMVGAEFTVRLTLFVTTEKPLESTTDAEIEKLPVAVGEHVRVELVLLHPTGNPE
jgi:hypothetical protein